MGPSVTADEGFQVLFSHVLSALVLSVISLHHASALKIKAEALSSALQSSMGRLLEHQAFFVCFLFFPGECIDLRTTLGSRGHGDCELTWPVMWTDREGQVPASQNTVMETN